MQWVYKRPIADATDQAGDRADRCMNVGVLCSSEGLPPAGGDGVLIDFVGTAAQFIK